MKRGFERHLACCVLALLAAAPGLAQAQAQAQVTPSTLPGAVQPGRGDRPAPEIPTQPDFDFSIEAPQRSAVGRAVDTVHFVLRDIHVEGARTLAPASFRDLYAGLIGKDIHLSDILDVADKIEQRYRDRGYILVRAYVPPQRVRDGVFTINVAEGKLSNVTVHGGTPATQAQIKDYLRHSQNLSPLPLATMERSLLLSNDLPGVSASGVLSPSPDVPGASDIDVTVNQPRYSGGLAADNRGSRFSGLWTLNADAEINSLFGDDQLAGFLTMAPDASEQVAGQLRYRRAVGSNGLVASLIGTITHGEPGSTLSAFGVLTNSWAVGPRLTYPVIRTRAQTLQLDGGFTAQDATIEVLGTRLSHDRWRVFDLTATWLRGDWLGGTFLADAGIAQGVPGLGASDNGDPDLSRKGGFTDFTKLTGQLRYSHPLGAGFSAILSAQGQFAFVPLINGELISFGGTLIGRGYDPGAITGDQGAGGSLELRYDRALGNPYVQGFEPYLYYETAATWYIQRGAAIDPALADQHLNSVGTGIRLALAHNATLALEAARTLNAVTGSDGGKEATKLFVSAGIRF